MPKAKDVMTECVVSVNKQAPVYEAAQLLATNDITGIPVVEDDMTVVGIITEKDVLDLFHVLQYAENRTVNSSMTQSAITFDAEDDLEDICQCLKNCYFRRVPVTLKGKLVGIISRRDLILYIIRCRQNNT